MQQPHDPTLSLKPSLMHMLAEGRSVFEFGAASLALPMLMSAPRGDGHPVMVLPGFLASDMSTKPLRVFLASKGYQAVGWDLGRNLGKHLVGGKHIISDELLDRVLTLAVTHNQPVSLVGWSLGGILAREIARLVPECVRQVITLGSPFNGPHGAAPIAAKLFDLINGDVAKKNPHAVAKMLEPPPVPTSALYSRSDGVAHWQACINTVPGSHEQVENIEVKGSHMGLGHNAQVLWIIADRLAQASGQWQPYTERRQRPRTSAH
jgi:pimeloyl-ACP methyl ester carboxylesterase